MEHVNEIPAKAPLFFGFGTALTYLKNGQAVTRKGWKNDSIKVLMQVPDEQSKMTEPYLYMEKWGNDGSLKRFPLDLSCESVLAEDWTVIE